MSIEIKRDEVIVQLSVQDFEVACRAGQLPPHTLVRLEAVTGDQFMPAGALEFYQVLVDPEIQSYERRLRTLAPLVTAALVGVQIRFWLWSKYPGADDFIVDYLTNWAPAVMESGEVYRMVSYGLLHLDLTHLALNLLFLAYAGWNLERAMGRANLVAVFGLSVIAGGLLSMLMSPGRPSLGASGGDFGLIAASVVFGWKNEDRLPTFARKLFGWAILPYLVYPLLLGLLSSGVDNWGHLGGLIGGGALATWLQPDGFKRFQVRNRILRRVATGVALAALLAVFAFGIRLVPLVEGQGAFGLAAPHPEGWREGWTFTEDRGWTSPLGTGTLVASTKSHSEPMTPELAVRAFLDQVDARSRGIVVLDQQELEFQGWPAVRLELRFDLGTEPQAMTALLVMRGAMVHRVTLHSPEAQHWRYRQLAAKVFDQTHLTIPPGLVAARWKTRQHPRSWEPALVHGRQAAMAGYPDEAGEQLLHAWELARGDKRADAAASLLDLYADYGVGLDPSEIDRIVAAHPDRVDVMVSGAAAYERAGREGEAQALLLEGWETQPGNHVLRRALESRGLTPR